MGLTDGGEEESSNAMEGLFSFGATKQSGSAPISRALHSAPLTFLREGGGFGGSGLAHGDGGVVLARADTADLLSLLDAVIQGEEVRLIQRSLISRRCLVPQARLLATVFSLSHALTSQVPLEAAPQCAPLSPHNNTLPWCPPQVPLEAALAAKRALTTTRGERQRMQFRSVHRLHGTVQDIPLTKASSWL